MSGKSWGPGFLGLTFGLALHGVSVGQFVFYVWAFPRDFTYIKLLVHIAFLLDNAQSIAVICAYYHILLACRFDSSPECMIYLPESIVLAMCLIYFTTFLVQGFYAHRVWIISSRNRTVTAVVLLLALTQFVFGLWGTVCLFYKPTYLVALTIKPPAVSAFASALCDAVITVSIYYYLRPARTGADRRGNYIKRLNFIFVQMGVLSLINALAVAIVYQIQDRGLSQVLSAAPGAILSKTYINSMLSVLNARKPIREEQEAQAQRPIEIPTIPTIF